MRGRLYCVIGPSGAGKDTLIAAAAKARPGLHWARRVITRPEVAGGEPYEGVEAEAFEARKASGEFALHWYAHGLGYGVPAGELAYREMGRDVIFNGSRGALPVIRAALPDVQVLQVTARPETLAARLLARGRESATEIAGRLSRGIGAPDSPDAVRIANDGPLDQALSRLLAVLDGSEPASGTRESR